MHRTVEVMDSSYQPSNAELEKDVRIDASPEEVARALMSTVNVQRASPAVKSPRIGKKWERGGGLGSPLPVRHYSI